MTLAYPALKKDYQKVHKAVSAFLRREKGADEQKSESKLVVSFADEVSKLTNKINLEITQAEVALNDTFTKLSESKEIDYSQAQVYNDLKNELTN